MGWVMYSWMEGSSTGRGLISAAGTIGKPVGSGKTLSTIANLLVAVLISRAETGKFTHNLAPGQTNTPAGQTISKTNCLPFDPNDRPVRVQQLQPDLPTRRYLGGQSVAHPPLSSRCHSR